MENFFSTLKLELLHHRRYRPQAEARLEVFEFIKHNRQRLHSSRGYMSPAAYAAKQAACCLPIAA